MDFLPALCGIAVGLIIGLLFSRRIRDQNIRYLVQVVGILFLGAAIGGIIMVSVGHLLGS